MLNLSLSCALQLAVIYFPHLAVDARCLCVYFDLKSVNLWTKSFKHICMIAYKLYDIMTPYLNNMHDTAVMD